MNAFAQTSDQKWGLGFYVGETEYKGDLGNRFFTLDVPYPMGGFFLGRYLNPNFDLALQADYGSYGFDNHTDHFLTKKIDADLLLKYKLNNGYILKENALFAPYIAVGGVIANYMDYKTEGSGSDVLIPLGAGLRFSVSP